jgi:hypothetical protein
MLYRENVRRLLPAHQERSQDNFVGIRATNQS